MLKLIQTIMGMFGGKKGGMPDLSQMGDMKKTAGDMLDQHEDKIDAITDKIPGEADDKLVEKAKEIL